MKMKMKLDEIRQRAGDLAKLLEGDSTLVGRGLRELSLLLEGLASVQQRADRARRIKK